MKKAKKMLPGLATPFMVCTVFIGAWLIPSSESFAQLDVKVRTSSFTYKPNGLLETETIEPDLVQDCMKTTYTYDNFSNRTSSSIAACLGSTLPTTASAATSRTTSLSYTADGRFPLNALNALNHSETKTFDPRHGLLTSLTGPNGLSTTWVYDGFGRKKLETRADGTQTRWTYELCTVALNNCPWTIGATKTDWLSTQQNFDVNGVATSALQTSFFDSFDRLLRVMTLAPEVGVNASVSLVQDTEYDGLGRVFRKSNSYKLAGGTPHWNTNYYDDVGRIVRQTAPDPDAVNSLATTSQAYDGLTTEITNAKQQTIRSTRNLDGHVVEVVDPIGARITHQINALGQIMTTNSVGVITKMEYNQRGQKVRMEDSSMGVWSYQYNAFGELVAQQDSLSQSSTMEYDKLGRMIKRSEIDLISDWSFDRSFDGKSCGLGIGKLCQAKASTGYLRTHNFDNKGRLITTATKLHNLTDTFSVSVSYNPVNGFLNSKTWPTGYGVTYGYTPNGYLKTLTGSGGGAAQTATYEILDIDPQGRVVKFKYGNEVVSTKIFDESTGKLKGIDARTAGAQAAVFKHDYGFDVLGNVLSRNDSKTGVLETFSYDSLNRLSGYQTQGAALGGGSGIANNANANIQVQYDLRGNISYKSDVGEYWYDPVRAYRLTQITLTKPFSGVALTGSRALSYLFDDSLGTPRIPHGSSIPFGNGNLMQTISHDSTSGKHTARWQQYTSFNMLREVKFGGIGSTSNSPSGAPAERTLSYLYGPEHQRVQQTVALSASAPSNFQPVTTLYLNGDSGGGLTYEKDEKANGLIEHKHYLSAGDITFGVQITRTGNVGALPPSALNYFHHDHLGSIASISNATGALIETLSYDPWGKRRNANGISDVSDSVSGAISKRGFTEHEHMDEVGLINMNGRVYDPLVGRFLSADPFIQAPYDSQSYNRYSYVMNNPINATDPSGYISFGRFFQQAMKFGDKVSGNVHAFITTPFTAPFGIGYEENYNRGYTFISGPNGYQLKSAINGFVSLFCFAGAPACNAGLTYALNRGYGAGHHAARKQADVVFISSTAFQVASLAGGAGEVGANSWERYAAHAAAGCVSAVANSGNCAQGAVAGVFGKATSNFIGNVGGDGFSGTLVRGAITVVAGGIGSEISGGSFSNGAKTAAYGYLFNEMLSRSSGQTYKSAGYRYDGDESRLTTSLETGRELSRWTGETRTIDSVMWGDFDAKLSDFLKPGKYLSENAVKLIDVKIEAGTQFSTTEYRNERGFERGFVTRDGSDFIRSSPAANQWTGDRFWAPRQDHPSSSSRVWRSCVGDMCSRQ